MAIDYTLEQLDGMSHEDLLRLVVDLDGINRIRAWTTLNNKHWGGVLVIDEICGRAFTVLQLLRHLHASDRRGLNHPSGSVRYGDPDEDSTVPGPARAFGAGQ